MIFIQSISTTPNTLEFYYCYFVKLLLFYYLVLFYSITELPELFALFVLIAFETLSIFTPLLFPSFKLLF